MMAEQWASILALHSGAALLWQVICWAIAAFYVLRLSLAPWRRNIRPFSPFSESFHGVMAFAMALMFSASIWGGIPHAAEVSTAVFLAYALGLAYRMLVLRGRLEGFVWWYEAIHLGMSLGMAYMTGMQWLSLPWGSYAFIAFFTLLTAYSLIYIGIDAIDSSGGFRTLPNPGLAKRLEQGSNCAHGVGMGVGMIVMYLWMLQSMDMGAMRMGPQPPRKTSPPSGPWPYGKKGRYGYGSQYARHVSGQKGARIGAPYSIRPLQSRRGLIFAACNVY